MRITGGSTDEVTDPEAPGYVANARQTDVTLIAFAFPPEVTSAVGEAGGDATAEELQDQVEQVAPVSWSGPEGELATMLMVIRDPGSGGAVLVPLSRETLLWEFEDAPAQPSNVVFASGGIDVLRIRLGAEATFGMTSAVTVPAEVITQLADQVGPITISLPDDVIVIDGAGDTSVRYAAGELTLQPDEVLEFLNVLGDDEPDSNRSLRFEQVWRAILTAGAALPGGLSVEGEGEAIDELEELVADLSSEFRFDQFPMEPIPIMADRPITLYRIDRDAMPDWVPEHVPFPVSAFPGQRARVELLNGTADSSALRSVAPAVVAAGGEIRLTGNAEAFDIAASRVEIGTPDAQVAGEQIAAALGVRVTERDDVSSKVDVVVVVGRDLLT